jgi:hypothetical protein|tara:strand:- start:5522 stop:5797 length:276 start_codon:yes stop_codon:yes gene_type:complete
VNTVNATWRLTLQVESTDKDNTKALADALTTDEAIEWDDGQTSFRFSIEESKAKDLRAMWNTRVRGLIAVDSLLGIISDSKQGEHSSTQTN